MRRRSLVLASIVLMFAFLAPISAAALAARAPDPGVSDGVTPTLTPEGTLVVLPAGWSRTIVLAKDIPLVDSALVPKYGPKPAQAPGVTPLVTCQSYQTGYTSSPTGFNHDYGLQARITVGGLPITLTDSCMGTEDGVAFWPGAVFPDGHYIQAGWLVKKGDGGTAARLFCQSNPGQTGSSAPNFGNGQVLSFLVVADSSNTWRTYYAVPGQPIVEIGCTLSEGTTNGQPVQWMGEVNIAGSTGTKMGPMTFSSLQWLDDARRWHTTASLSAWYTVGASQSRTQALGCPPYGAGSIASGSWTSGSGQSCTLGTFNYP